MPQSEISAWLQFALQQMAAESYLDGINWNNAEQVKIQLRLGNNRPGFPESGATRFTGTPTRGLQEQSFVDRYQIVDHHANDATGFSATLMRNRDTGEYTLSFRSTEYRNPDQGGDFARDGILGADGEIFNNGLAFGQLAAMETYYRELKSSAKLPIGSTLNVTGYSLGGHLATVFTELHHNDSDMAFGHTYTFNGAGRGHITGTEAREAERIRGMLTLVEAIVRNPDAALPYTTADDPAYLTATGAGAGWNPFAEGSLENAYLDPRYALAKQIALSQYGTTGLSSSPAPGEVGTSEAFQKITQLFGHATHNDIEYVANRGVHGVATSIFIEDQPDLDGFGGFFGLNGDFGTTHSITLMIDSLALQEAFHNIDPSLSRLGLEQILAASSNQMASGFIGASGLAEGDSLENALDALGKLYVPTYTSTNFGRQTGDFGRLTFRNEFYDHLQQVNALPNSGQVISLVEMPLLDMVSQAETDVAYRYALKELNPFVVLGADYAGHNTQGQLDHFNSVDGTGSLTHEFIFDRSLFLAKKIELNLADSEAGVTGIHYQDFATGYEIDPTFSGSEYLFGGDASEAIEGKSGDDRLYGGAGNDMLTGEAGDDYLQGDQGNDILIGGAGNDVLKGGAGFDTYNYDSGDGNDRIEDAYGQNVILFNGLALQSGVHRDGDQSNIYTSMDGRVTYQLIDGDLLANNGQLTLNENFQSGQFGIRLIDETSYANGLADLSFTFGETDDTFLSGGTAGNLLVHMGAGNDSVFAGRNNDQLFGEAGDDALFGNSADDRLYGGAGNDVLAGDNDEATVTDGHDLLEGGDGDDRLIGGWGNDLLYGGGGRDVLYGDSTGKAQGAFTADDVLDGGAGDDELHGLSGNDVLHGGAGNDFLSGEEGDDIEHGGTGNDLVLGYTGNDTLFGNEGMDKLYGDQGDDILIAGSEVDELRGGDGADNLFGGTGDDLLYGDSLNNPSQDSFAGGNDFLNGEEGNDTLRGGDGTDTLLGGAHDDVLYGDAGNDVLDGGIGNDRLSGGPGADVYIIGTGWGQDIIEEAEAEDEVLADVLSSAVDIARASNDLVITTVGTTDQFTLRSFFTSTLNQVGRVQFADGVTLDTAALIERSRLITGTEGPDILTGFENSDDILSGLGGEDFLEGLSGHDVFDGGPGNDTIYGGGGNDSYLFGPGSGTDVVQEDDFIGTDVDTIEVFAGVLPEDVTLRGLRIEGTFSRDLSLVINGTNDELRVTGFFDDPSFRIDQVKFADGTTWDEATIQSKAEVEGFHITTSSDNGVELLGTHFRDRITGGGGNDSIIGFQGNDVLKGEGGDDFLSGYEGDDALFGGAGNDTLVGDDGADQMTGGIGNDRFQVNDPGDVIIEADGEGRDLVSVESLTSYTLPGHFEDLELTTNGVVPVLIGIGNSGNNELHGNFYDNVLEGGEGNDRLWGGSANRFVGPNNDELRGGSGDDTYFFDAFSGTATIHDISVGGEGNRLQFGAGIRPGDLAFVQNGGRLEISVVSTGDLVVLADFDSSNVVGSIVTERVEFTGNLDQVVGDFQVKLADFLTPTVGTNGNDLFEGTVSVDVIRAAAGDDRLQGNAGNDVLSGGAGSDTYVFNIGDGFDLIDDQATAGETNTVVFGAGIDPQAMRLEYAGHGGALTIKVGAEGLQMMGFNSLDPLAMQPIETFQFADGTILSLSDLLVRGVDMTGISLIPFGGVERLGGTFVDDRMAGLEGDDSLYGGAGADRLIGGGGDDVLIGGEGQDTYVFRLGDGVDKIEDAAEIFSDAADPEGGSIVRDNQIQFGEGITLSDLTLVEGQDGITIRKILVGSNGDAVWLPNFADALPGLTTAMFSDGLTVNIYNLLAAGLITEDQFIEGGGTLIGGKGNDTLTAGAGNTFLLGGNGDDTLIGGAGNCSFYGGAGTNLLVGGSGGNTFVISPGSGANTIRLPFANLLGTNTVSFGAGYSSFNPKLGFGSLLIRYGTEGGELHIEDFNPNDAYRNPGIETFQFTDRTFTYREFIELGFDLWGTGGDDVITGTNVVDRLMGFDGNDQLTSGVGHDTLTGGYGNDLLIGGGGDDAYVFNVGDGVDTIQDTALVGEGNRIQFGVGIASGDLAFTQSGNTLTVQVGSGGDALQLTNSDPANAGSLAVKTLLFADGSSVDLADLLGTGATDGDDLITTGSGDQTIDAKAGNDFVQTGAGNDTLSGGTGNDILGGGAGHDTYLYNVGDGLDTINDTAAPGEGNTLIFGTDIILGAVSLGFDLSGLILQVGTAGDAIHLSTFNPADAFGLHAIDTFQFADSMTLSYGQLIDRGFDLTGTASDDTMTGTNAVDRLSGLAGNDMLQSGAGDDVLEGNGDRLLSLDGNLRGRNVDTAQARRSRRPGERLGPHPWRVRIQDTS